jgi:hypothetical protein
MRTCISPLWPGHSRPKDGVATLAYTRPLMSFRF